MKIYNSGPALSYYYTIDYSSKEIKDLSKKHASKSYDMALRIYMHIVN